MTNYISQKIAILKDLHVFSKCSKTEKQELKSRTTEIAVDNYARMLINKYLA